jgi:hypothetical protein
MHAAPVILTSKEKKSNRKTFPFLLLESIRGFLSLKVDGNEKYGGLRFLQCLGISLGPW